MLVVWFEKRVDEVVGRAEVEMGDEIKLELWEVVETEVELVMPGEVDETVLELVGGAVELMEEELIGGEVDVVELVEGELDDTVVELGGELVDTVVDLVGGDVEVTEMELVGLVEMSRLEEMVELVGPSELELLEMSVRSELDCEMNGGSQIAMRGKRHS